VGLGSGILFHVNYLRGEVTVRQGHPIDGANCFLTVNRLLAGLVVGRNCERFDSPCQTNEVRLTELVTNFPKTGTRELGRT